MTRQTYSAHIVAGTHSMKTRPHPNPSMDTHTQFLPGDRATQILLQQFL